MIQYIASPSPSHTPLKKRRLRPVIVLGRRFQQIADLARESRCTHPHDGVVFFILLIGYGAYRLAITPFRIEALASMKLFSAIFVAVGILGLVWSVRSKTEA
jgi:prolipoprotein diacylglyceryltransferase